MDCDLVPKSLVINRYFSSEKKAIEELQIKLENISREIEELVEENNGDEGYFADFDKVNKANVTARIKEIKKKPDDAEELKVMEKFLALGELESEAKKRIKEAEKVLDAKVVAKYKTLTEEEIKVLVVDDKWMATLEQTVKGEMDRISQRLTQRIKELAERYEFTLSQLNEDVEVLEKKVNAHLLEMGFSK
jgi:type I restriction enzyme M protein